MIDSRPVQDEAGVYTAGHTTDPPGTCRGLLKNVWGRCTRLVLHLATISYQKGTSPISASDYDNGLATTTSIVSPTVTTMSHASSGENLRGYLQKRLRLRGILCRQHLPSLTPDSSATQHSKKILTRRLRQVRTRLIDWAGHSQSLTRSPVESAPLRRSPRSEQPVTPFIRGYWVSTFGSDRYCHCPLN